MAGTLNLRKSMVRLILPALRTVSPQSGSRVLNWIGRTKYACASSIKSSYDEAVTRGGDLLGCRWDVPEVSKSLAGNVVRWRTRDLLLDGRLDQEVTPLFHVEGRENLDKSVDAGKGVILLGNHYGAHLLPAHWLYREGYPLRLYMERPRHVSKYMMSHFDDDGPLGQKKLFISRKGDACDAASSILRASRALRSGLIMHLACDVRWSGPHSTDATFLGSKYSFSTTWLTLAGMTGASVIPVYCGVCPDATYRLEFGEGYTVPQDESRGERTGVWVQRALDDIADHIRRDPANSNDYFFWDSPAGQAA